MPVSSQAVGTVLAPVEMLASTRRLLAYAGVLEEPSDCCFNDADTENFMALPQFCVSPEWQLAIQSRKSDPDALGLTAEERRMGVHVGQDSTFHRPIRPTVQLVTRGKIGAVRQTRAGALVVSAFETSDNESGALLVSSHSTTVYRGVEVSGADLSQGQASMPPSFAPQEITRHTLPIDRFFPHRYSECADIWNPIHTERRVALAAGLPDIIVHGTALWALAGREVIRRFAPGKPASLLRLAGRFSAMVIPGSEVVLEMGEAAPTEATSAHQVGFTLYNMAGDRAISGGYAELSRSDTAAN